MKTAVAFVLLLTLAGCAGQGPGFLNGLRSPSATAPDPAPGADAMAEPDPTAETPGEVSQPNATAPAAAIVAPPENARTIEEFDTTTPEAREAAVAPAPTPQADPTGGRLGTTVASIGDPAEPGFWIRTPLVAARAPGRVYYAATGRTVQVQLIPSGGPAGGGSQVSLATMRLLDAPLDSLPELVVYAN